MTIPGGLTFAGGTLKRIANVRVAIPGFTSVVFGTVTRFPRAVPECLMYMDSGAVVLTNRNVFGFAALTPSGGFRQRTTHCEFVREPGMTSGEYALLVSNDFEEPIGNPLPVTVDLFHYEVIP